jgi:putative FmdB family regulatory protein
MEEFQSMMAAPLVKCPNCGKDSLKRAMGTGAGLIFKGSGFYLTDYKKSSVSSKNESKPKKKEDSTPPNDTSKTDTPKKDTGSSSKPASPPSDKKP